MYVCVCERERERDKKMNVCERKRERKCVCVCVCVSPLTHRQPQPWQHWTQQPVAGHHGELEPPEGDAVVPGGLGDGQEHGLVLGRGGTRERSEREG